MIEPSLLMVWAAVAALSLVLGLIALRATDSAGIRALVVAIVVVVSAVTYGGGERVLGNARPVSFEIVKPAEPSRVLYTQAVRGKGIYLLVATEKSPTYFKLPWSEKTAKELRKALEQAEQNQMPLMFRFERSLDDRKPMFYAMPQPALPEKQMPKPGLEYQDREWRI
jgi:hypothetical protein